MVPPPRKPIETKYTCIAFLVALSFAGCGDRSTVSRSPSTVAGSIGTASWSDLKRINPKAKVGEAQAVYVVLPSRRIAFAILMDFVGRFKGTDEKFGTETKYIGVHEASDGRKVEWQWTTTDDKSGTMTINGSTYNLTDGAFFFVFAHDGQVRVRQLQTDLVNLGADNPKQSLERLLTEDPNVAESLREPSTSNTR